ncbi:MAG: nuclear transport factor 2 family protein [Thermoanaerobaculia bacterium]
MRSHYSASASLLALALSGFVPPGAPENVPDLLRRQTDELVDAISSGSAAVWDRYLDPEARYIDESGEVQTKKQLIEGIRALPEGVSGSIQIQDFDVLVHGDVAVATYVDDENEVFHGHKLHCQYRTTDTWTKTPEGWRLIAGQVVALRTDPPAVPIASALREQYCGQYALTPAITYEIRCQGDTLEGRQTGRKPETLRAEAPDVLFVPGKPRFRYMFLRDAGGKITGFAQRREAWDLVWERVSSKPRS